MIRKILNIGSKKDGSDSHHGPRSPVNQSKKKLGVGRKIFNTNLGDEEPTENDDSHTSFNNSDSDFTATTLSSSLSSFNNASLHASITSPTGSVKSRVERIDEVQEEEEESPPPPPSSPKSINKKSSSADDDDDGGSRPPPDEAEIAKRRKKKGSSSSKKKKGSKSGSDKKNKQQHPSSADHDDDPESRPVSSRKDGSGSTKGKKTRSRSKGEKRPRKAKSLRARLSKREKSEKEPDEIIDRLFVKDDAMSNVADKKWNKWRSTGDLMVKPTLQSETEAAEQLKLMLGAANAQFSPKASPKGGKKKSILKVSSANSMVKPPPLVSDMKREKQLNKILGSPNEQFSPKSPKGGKKKSISKDTDDLYSRLSKMTLETVVSGEELMVSPRDDDKTVRRKNVNKKKSKKKPNRSSSDELSHTSDSASIEKDGDGTSSGGKKTIKKGKRPSTKAAAIMALREVDDENIARKSNMTPSKKKSNKLWKSTGDLGSYLKSAESKKMSVSTGNASWHSTDDGDALLSIEEGAEIDKGKAEKRRSRSLTKSSSASPRKRKSGSSKPKRKNSKKLTKLLGELEEEDDHDEVDIGILQKQEHSELLVAPNSEEEGSSRSSKSSGSDIMKSSSCPEENPPKQQLRLSGKLQQAASQVMEQKFIIASLKKELAAYQTGDDDATASSAAIRNEGWKYAQHKIHTLQAENYHLETANGDLEKELLNVRQELEEKSAQHDKLVIDLYDIECQETDTVKALKKKLEDAQRRIEMLEEESESLHNSTTDSDSLSAKGNNAVSIERQKAGLQAIVKEIIQQIGELSQAKSAELSEKEDAIKKLKEDIEFLGSKIQSLNAQARPDQLGTFLQQRTARTERGNEDESIDSRLLSLNEELLQNQTALKTQIDKLSVQNSNLHDKLDRELRGSSVRLSQDAVQLKVRMSEIETLQKELASAKQIVVELEEENDRLQDSNSYLKTDLEEAKERNICLAKSLADQETKILDLQRRVIEREAAWKQELKDLLQDTTGLETRIDEERLKTSAQLSKQELELAAQGVTVASLRAELAESRKKLDVMNKDLTMASQQLASKSKKCDELESAISYRDSRILVLEEKILQKKTLQYQNAFDVSRENAALKKQVEEEISKLRYKIEERDMRIQGLSKKLAQHEANLTREALDSTEKSNFQSKIAEYESEVSQLKKLLAERDLKVKFLDDVITQSKTAWMQERNSLMKDQADLLSKLEEAMEALQKESANRELILRASGEEGALIEARSREQIRALSEQNSALRASIVEKDNALTRLQNDLIESDLIFKSYDAAAGHWNEERMELMEETAASRGALELAVSTLQKQLAEKDSRIQELDRELAKDESGIRQLLAASEGEKRALQESLKKNEYTVASLRRQLESQERINSDSDGSAEETNAENASLRSRLTSERRASSLQLASKDDILDSIRMKLEEKESRIEWLEQCLKRKEADWRNELGELLQETADLTNEGRTAAAELATKNGIIAALEGELRDKEARIQELTNSKGTSMRRTSKVEQLKIAMAAEDMQGELADCRAKMAKSSAELDEARQRIAELEDVVCAMESTKIYLDTKSSHGETSSLGEEGRLEREIAKRRIKFGLEPRARNTKCDSSTESERSADQAAGGSSRSSRCIK